MKRETTMMDEANDMSTPRNDQSSDTMGPRETTTMAAPPKCDELESTLQNPDDAQLLQLISRINRKLAAADADATPSSASSRQQSQWNSTSAVTEKINDRVRIQKNAHDPGLTEAMGLASEIAHQDAPLAECEPRFTLEAELVEHTLFHEFLHPKTHAPINLDLERAFPPCGNIHVPALLHMRGELRYVFGYKSDYGRFVLAEASKRKRAFAEEQAEHFLKTCCRSSHNGDMEAYQNIMKEFHKRRIELGWKDDYGMLVSRVNAEERREEAERKAGEALRRVTFAGSGVLRTKALEQTRKIWEG